MTGGRRAVRVGPMACHFDSRYTGMVGGMRGKGDMRAALCAKLVNRRLDGAYRRFAFPDRTLDGRSDLWRDADLAATIARGWQRRPIGAVRRSSRSTFVQCAQAAILRVFECLYSSLPETHPEDGRPRCSPSCFSVARGLFFEGGGPVLDQRERRRRGVLRGHSLEELLAVGRHVVPGGGRVASW
jgi:hypothetical protein